MAQAEITQAEIQTVLPTVSATIADALGCAEAIARCRSIVGDGTSADTQLAVFEANTDGRNRNNALRAVTDWIATATLQ